MKNKIESCVQVLEKTLSGLQWSFPKKKLILLWLDEL